MKIRHKLINYLPEFILMILIWVPNWRQRRDVFSPLFLLLFDMIVLMCVLVVHFTDYLMIDEGIIEGKELKVSPKIEILTLSAPRSRIRSCELRRFLFWNTITVKGPLGVTLVMHNMSRASRFTEEVKERW